MTDPRDEAIIREAEWDGNSTLIEDNEATPLLRDGKDRLGIICCCDCGLVHRMAVDTENDTMRVVRDDTAQADLIRRKAQEAGHDFVLQSEIRRLQERVRDQDDALTAIHETLCAVEPMLTTVEQARQVVAAIEWCKTKKQPEWNERLAAWRFANPAK